MEKYQNLGKNLMPSNHKILFIIPARGGSKGLKGKNIKVCADKPLIEWTIDAALESKYCEHIVISTDSEEIAKFSESKGITMYGLRTSELSSDTSSMLSVVQYELARFRSRYANLQISAAVILQPTSPLRTSRHIDEAIDYYFTNRKTAEDTLISVKTVDSKYSWIMQENKSGYLSFVSNKINSLNPTRQDLIDLYLPNGAIFILPILTLDRWVYGENTMFYVMSEVASIDIDNEEDFRAAESRLRDANSM
jgi:CMP-N-acetylneuraminic acid synthetase